MKRSEAIQLIKNNLKKNFYPGTGYGIDEAYTKKAESILDLIETHIGMLPPEINPPMICTEAEIVISKEYFDEYVPSQFILGWEKE